MLQNTLAPQGKRTEPRGSTDCGPLPRVAAVGSLEVRIMCGQISVCVCVCFSSQLCPTLCDPMDCSLPTPLSMGFSRQECWSGLPSPSPGDLPNPVIKPSSPALQADSLPSGPPRKPKLHTCSNLKVRNIFN